MDTRLRIVSILAGIVAACGLFPDVGPLIGDAGALDAQGEDVVQNEAGGDGGVVSCSATAPFGTPKLLSELDTADENGVPHLTHDELTIYFERSPSGDASAVGGGAGGLDLFTATRTSPTGTFGVATALALDTAAGEWDPTVTDDDLSLYFASDRDGGLGQRDLYLATRTSVVGAFAAPTNVAALNTPYDECCAYVMPDGLTLYYAREPQGADWQMFRATRTPTTSFSEDTSGIFDAINTSSVEQTPTVTLDELTVYYGSDRNGGKGEVDIWRATRASRSVPFGDPVNVSELNTAGYDYPGWISDDGCRLYFMSDVSGTTQIFVASKN